MRCPVCDAIISSSDMGIRAHWRTRKVPHPPELMPTPKRQAISVTVRDEVDLYLIDRAKGYQERTWSRQKKQGF